MIESGIYIIENTINHKVYVGSAVNLRTRRNQHSNRLRCGKHPNVHLQRAWGKDGPGAFEFRVSVRCSVDDLIECEQLMLDVYKRDIGWKRMYNMQPVAGSCLGVKQSPETREKMSESHKGVKKSAKARVNMREAQLGKKHSLETRKKISVTQRNRMHKRTPAQKQADRDRMLGNTYRHDFYAPKGPGKD